MIVKPPLGSQIIDHHPLGQDGGLVGCWLMNEGSGDKVFDLSGNGNSGTLQNSTYWTAGKFGTCLSLDDASDDYVLTPIEWTTLKPTGGDCTLSIWFNRATTSNGYYALFGGTTSDKNSLFYYNNKIYWKVGNTAMSVNVTINAGVWYHVVATAKNTTGEVFVNGISYGTGSIATSAQSNDLIIGQVEADQGIYNFNGKLDIPFAYKNRALTASEIAELYSYPFCMFWQYPIELLVGAVGAAPGGDPGIMTLNTGYWGPTYNG